MACPWEERLIRWPLLFLSQHFSLSMQVAATSASQPVAGSSRHCNMSPTPATIFFRRRSVLIHHNQSRPQHCRRRSSSPWSHCRWRKTKDSSWSRSWRATWLTCSPPSSKGGHASLSSSSSASLPPTQRRRSGRDDPISQQKWTAGIEESPCRFLWIELCRTPIGNRYQLSASHLQQSHRCIHIHLNQHPNNHFSTII